MTKAISKKEQALSRFEANRAAFRCPICQSELITRQDPGLYCKNRHSFDLARSGYINLFVGSQNLQYDKDLFTARRQVFASGLYDPLVAKVASVIVELGLVNPFVLDAGCGEGSFLARLEKHLSGRFLGIDISKDGIRLAAAQNSPLMWCVADLAELPLQPASLDVVLNILSPANYREFQRVLKPEGVVVKVLPGEDYLKEIRLRLDDVKSYSNKEVLEHLEANMQIQKNTNLNYKVPINHDLWKQVVAMTPLTQHRKVEGPKPEYLTVDLQVIQGTLSNLPKLAQGIKDKV